LTGRGVRIAVIDSGVHASHPHINRIAGGVSIDALGVEGPDYIDRLGHGTAVAAAILEKAPDADLFPVRVFDRSLTTSITALVAAIEWAVRQDMHLVNLSLGTARPAHQAALRAAVDRAIAAGVAMVSARRDDEGASAAWFPGSLPGVIGVEVDWTIGRDQYRVVDREGQPTLRASGFPRDIPGVAPQRNLHGVSFAVANSTGFAARACQAIAPQRSIGALVTFLKDHAPEGAP